MKKIQAIVKSYGTKGISLILRQATSRLSELAEKQSTKDIAEELGTIRELMAKAIDEETKRTN